MKQLTQEQLAVVADPDRVFALADSRKSPTMAYRIQYLINHHGVHPDLSQVLIYFAFV